MANSTGFPDPHQPRTATQPLQAPTLTTYPDRRADYSGAPTASDAGTIANVQPKPDYPGSAGPNAPTKRSPERLTGLSVSGEPVPGRGGRRPVR